MTITAPTDATHAFFQNLADRQREFDANRPPCPDIWCNGECDHNLHFGDSVHHTTDETTVPATADYNDMAGTASVRAWRADCLSSGSESLVELNIFESGSAIEECAQFTAEQARHLAAELLRHADLIDPR